MSDPVLRLSRVTLRRHGRNLLDAVDWEVSTGERWVVLGPNGAGKTTLLRLASTYEVPSAGEQDVLGERVGRVDLRELRECIGFASHALARLVPDPTRVRDLVVMGSDATLRRGRREYDDAQWEEADRLLEVVRCTHLAGERFSTLSAGEQQRVQIARALMGAPELLLLDEPTAGLDVGGREQLVGILDELAGSELPAIVFVTHHPEEIPPAFTHALLLRDGRVHASGALGSVMVSELLSSCFGIPLRVERRDGRYRAWLLDAGT